MKIHDPLFLPFHLQDPWAPSRQQSARTHRYCWTRFPDSWAGNGISSHFQAPNSHRDFQLKRTRLVAKHSDERLTGVSERQGWPLPHSHHAPLRQRPPRNTSEQRLEARQCSTHTHLQGQNTHQATNARSERKEKKTTAFPTLPLKIQTSFEHFFFINYKS